MTDPITRSFIRARASERDDSAENKTTRNAGTSEPNHVPTGERVLRRTRDEAKRPKCAWIFFSTSVQRKKLIITALPGSLRLSSDSDDDDADDEEKDVFLLERRRR